MKRLLMIILFLTLGVLVSKAAPGDAKAGQTAYTKSCGACHAADGAPKEAVAKMLKVEMKHLGVAAVQGKTDDQLRKDMVEGSGKMKGVKLDDKQVADLLAYMRTLKK